MVSVKSELNMGIRSSVAWAPALVSVLSMSLVDRASASSGAWSGSADALWANSANWSASPDPSGGDTATFSGASGNTTVDISGLYGILSITFVTTATTSYTVTNGASWVILEQGEA